MDRKTKGNLETEKQEALSQLDAIVEWIKDPAIHPECITVIKDHGDGPGPVAALAALRSMIEIGWPVENKVLVDCEEVIAGDPDFQPWSTWRKYRPLGTGTLIMFKRGNVDELWKEYVQSLA